MRMGLVVRSVHVLVALSVLGIWGCKEEKKPEATPAAATTPAAPKPSAAPSAAAPGSAAAKKATKPPPPPGAPAKKPVPTDWEHRDFPAKGYSFWVPKGVKDETHKDKGLEIYGGKLPAPHEKVSMLVLAFKDPAKKFPELKTLVEEMLKDIDGATGYKVDKEEDYNEFYKYIWVSYTDKDKKKVTAKVMLGLDVTDRYIMLVGTDGDFKAEEETINEIHDSFEMYSDRN